MEFVNGSSFTLNKLSEMVLGKPEPMNLNNYTLTEGYLRDGDQIIECTLYIPKCANSITECKCDYIVCNTKE